MTPRTIKRTLVMALSAAALALAVVPGAQAAFDDPLFVVRPGPPPPEQPPAPPEENFEGPCGLAVDSAGRVYVSDYYHHAIEVFGTNFGPTYPYGYNTQIANVDPLDGPCGLAFDATNNLYVNELHRNVLKFGPYPAFGPGAVFAGVGSAEPTPSHSTGVAVNQQDGTVFVDQRTFISVFSVAGVSLGSLAENTLGDGHGMAVSEYPGTKGLVYVADAADDRVKVYAPDVLAPEAPPVAEIDGSATPVGHFVSLRDAAIAVDRVSGEIYVSDNLQPVYAEQPETVVYVFDSAGGYLGRLKFSIENAIPPGLTVDNSATATQGRVYVTSGNTESAAVFAYPPHAVTSVGVPLPRSAAAPGGSGGGSGSGSSAPGLEEAPPAPAVAPSAAAAVGAQAAAPAPTAKRQRTHKRHKKAHKRHRAAHRHARRHAR